MSHTLSLVEYFRDDEGHLYEERSRVVESAFLPPELAEVFEARSFLRDAVLFEEPASAESSVIRCVDELSLDKALLVLEEEFVKAVSSEAATRMKDVLVRDELSDLISEFRSITNLYHLVKLKIDKFPHHPNVLLKLG